MRLICRYGSLSFFSPHNKSLLFSCSFTNKSSEYVEMLQITKSCCGNAIFLDFWMKPRCLPSLNFSNLFNPYITSFPFLFQCPQHPTLLLAAIHSLFHPSSSQSVFPCWPDPPIPCAVCSLSCSPASPVLLCVPL